jgi:hypothetical protein
VAGFSLLQSSFVRVYNTACFSSVGTGDVLISVTCWGSSVRDLPMYNFVLIFPFSNDTLSSRHYAKVIPLQAAKRPLKLREVEAPTFSDIRLTDGGKVMSPTRWPLFYSQKDS